MYMIEHLLKLLGITVAFVEIAGLAVFGIVILSKFYD